MSRPVDHDCLILLLIRCPYNDDVEPAVSKKKCGATSESLGGSRIQYFYFDSRVRWGLRVVGRFDDRRGLICANSLVSSPPIVTDTAHHGGEKHPASDFQCKLALSATASGKM